MKPVYEKTRSARSFWTIVITAATAVIIAGLIGGVCWQQWPLKERAQLTSATTTASTKTDQDSAAVRAPTPAGTGKKASPEPMPVSSLLFPYGKEELHPFKDYLGEGDMPQYHFAVDGNNRIYILGSSPGILVIDPARKSREVLPLPVKPWQGFTAFSPDLKGDNVYFLITQGVTGENEVILSKAKIVGAKTIHCEEVSIDVSPGNFRELNAEGNRIFIAGNKVYVYDHVFSHLLAAIENGSVEKSKYMKFFGCPGWRSGNFYKAETIGAGEKPVDLSSAGPVYFHREEVLKMKHVRPERGLIRIFRSSGEFLRNVEFKVTGLLSIDFLGEDDDGNFYIQVEKEGEKSIELEVHKFDGAGNHLAVLNISDTKGYAGIWSNKPLLLGKNGAIWQVLPTNDGWRINGWNM
ncbi:MAG: hypothetical protein XD78_0681 [Desulfotomaculum sp. 46_296]|nr:MAG: hypothetical protein XD78_0681 [Desulfotomaculum sp. 46_296]HAU30861.1 hypothetical protein [Desulfotomaculum sp.]